jgi:hypothetical protein
LNKAIRFRKNNGFDIDFIELINELFSGKQASVSLSGSAFA